MIQLTLLCILTCAVLRVTSCPCPAGTHCLHDDNDCRKCEVGKYQDQPSTQAYSCADCSVSCRQKEIVVKTCNISNNLICQCEPGYYKSPELNGPCLPHNSCKAGFEQKAPGNHINDTLCEPCGDGKFRTAESVSKSCVRCRKCSEEEEEESPCSPSKDTVCRSKSDPAVVIGVCVGVGFVLVLLIIIILVCLHRKGYDMQFWKSRLSHRSEEKCQPGSDGYHLAGSTDSPKSQRNGATRTPSSESNGQLRVKLGSTSSTATTESGRHRMHSGSTSPTQGSEFLNFIMKISEDLCSMPEWKMFMRSLISDGADMFINAAVADNPNNVQEQIYQVFKKWMRRNPDEANKERVIQELKNNEWNLIAHKYDESIVTDV